MLKILKSILGFFTLEPARKILALLFAFGLWLFVAIDGRYSYEREILVKYTSLPEAYIITDSLTKLKISFSGKGKALFGIWANPPEAECNLSEVVPGKNVISTKDLAMPLEDVLVNYGAKFINVEVDEKVSKTVKPLIPIKGVLKNGFSISTIESLDTIQITGPKKILQKLNEVSVESLDVKNQSATFEKTLKLDPVSSLIKFSTENLRVRVVIDTSDQRIFTNVPVNILKNAGQKIWISNQSIDTLIVQGARSQVSGLIKENIGLRIKTTDLVGGEYDLSPEIILPEFLSSVYIKPQRIKVVVY
ncbi:MAG: CdaR family protein [bacterium]